MEMNRIEQLWDDLEHDPETNWDDLYEYDVRGLMDRYDITMNEADLLWANIQALTNPARDVTKCEPARIGEYALEALHQGLDGWTIEQGMVIQAFLADIAYCCSTDQPEQKGE